LALQPRGIGLLQSEYADLPAILLQPACGPPQAQAGRVGSGSMATAPGLAQEAFLSPGFSLYELLRLIYDRPAQACGFPA
jgi:hypothetical protein